MLREGLNPQSFSETMREDGDASQSESVLFWVSFENRVEKGGVPLTVPKPGGWAGECATEVSVTMCGTTSVDN